jgi:hypothetical protein
MEQQQPQWLIPALVPFLPARPGPPPHLLYLAISLAPAFLAYKSNSRSFAVLGGLVVTLDALRRTAAWTLDSSIDINNRRMTSAFSLFVLWTLTGLMLTFGWTELLNFSRQDMLKMSVLYSVWGFLGYKEGRP